MSSAIRTHQLLFFPMPRSFCTDILWYGGYTGSGDSEMNVATLHEVPARLRGTRHACVGSKPPSAELGDSEK